MKFLSIAILALLLTTAGMTRAEVPVTTYQSLLAKARAGEAVDWQALRFAYAETVDLDISQINVRREMFTAYNSGDLEKALGQAKLIISAAYVDGEAHLIASLALRGLNRDLEADTELAIAQGIFRSIQTGDGLSPENAFTVISVDEEYQLLRALGYRLKQQALSRVGGHSYDVMTVTNDHGETTVLYFQIDRVVAAEMKAFGFGGK